MKESCQEFGKENFFRIPKSSEILGRFLENALGKVRECGLMLPGLISLCARHMLTMVWVIMKDHKNLSLDTISLAIGSQV